jgi:hypothetical protein
MGFLPQAPLPALLVEKHEAVARRQRRTVRHGIAFAPGDIVAEAGPMPGLIGRAGPARPAAQCDIRIIWRHASAAASGGSRVRPACSRSDAPTLSVAGTRTNPPSETRQGRGRPGGTVEHVAIRRRQLQAHRRGLLILALETVPRPFYRALRLSTG